MNYLDITCRNKLKSIFSQYSLLQLIDEPTHYTETSSSLIDLIFTTNVSSVLFSGVGEAFLDQISVTIAQYMWFLTLKTINLNVSRGKYGNTIVVTMKL